MRHQHTIRIALASGAALLSACSTMAPPVAPPTVRTPVELSTAELTRRIDAYFAPLAGTADFSGTIRVERDGAPVLVRHFGYADWRQRTPHRDDTRYSAASVTKGIVAASLVTLVRDGTVSLDAPVGRWLPELDPYPDMTLRGVLAHRAGLPRDLPGDFDPSRGSVAGWLVAHPDRITGAGEERYSNVGYALLAEVIAAAADAPFTEVAERRVLRPAGMKDSMIRLATAEHFPNGALPYTGGPAPSGVVTPVPAPLEVGGSGLITTAADLAAWARTLADGAYPELFAGSDPLGSIDTGRDDHGSYVSVQGTLPGYAANAIAWRDTNLTISFAGNLFSYPVLNMGDVLRALLSGDPPAPPTPRPSDVPLTEDHRRLTGRYQHPELGPIAVAYDTARGGMMLTLPGKPAHWSFYLAPIADGGLHWRAFDTVLRSDAAGGLVAVIPRPGQANRQLPLPPFEEAAGQAVKP